MIPDPWHIEPGELEHRAAPGFRAKWSVGSDALETIVGFYWSEEGGSDEDVIHVYDFAWSASSPPNQESFERLMREAVSAIDRWIRARM